MSPHRVVDLEPGHATEWARVGLRKTPQREVVLGLVRSCYDHPTADWILTQGRRVIRDMSLATVYRTLRLLKEKGLIYEFSGGASPSRFDGTIHTHEHVRCICCGEVKDIDIPGLGDLRREVADRTGFALGPYPLLFQGICENCVRRSPGARKPGPCAEAPPIEDES
jgi:Fe2+ or Zn2+ uptake regulation protein